MTTIQYIHEYVFPASELLLPTIPRSKEAAAFLLSIGLQESGFKHRRQVPSGIAHSFWQMEKYGGVAGVLAHPKTAPLLAPVLQTLRYEATETACYDGITHNDILACVFARLLLWTVPGALPGPTEAAKGWQQYLEGWRPGRPRREAWDNNFSTAWGVL